MARFSLPDELPDAFTVGEAFALGASERRLRGADLDAPFRGARILSTTDDEPDAEDAAALWERRRAEHLRLMRAYAPILAQGGFFCGPSAAVAWRIPIPQRLWPSDVHVGAHRPKRAPRRPDVRGYQFTRGFIHLAALEELPVTDPASTWATLGRDLYENELVAAADRLLRVPRHPGGFKPVTEQPLASRRELEMLTERKGRPGAPALRGALDLARTGSSSPPETQVRLLLREFSLPEPALDVDVYDDFGRFLGCSELAYPELKVAIEYESDGHLTRTQLQRDIDKYQLYAEAGWYPVRLTSEHVYRFPSEAARRVRLARAAASDRRPPDPSMWR